MRIPQLAASAFACAFAASLSAQTAGFGFGAYTTIPGAVPGYLAIGDVTGDARDDLVELGTGTSGVDGFRLFVQQADGTLAAPVVVSIGKPLAGALASLALADVDGDGVKDVALGYSNFQVGMPGNGVAVVRRNGSGGWTALAAASTKRAAMLATLDVDRDGRTDVVALAPDEGFAVYRLTSGGAWFSAAGAPAAPAGVARRLAAGDLDGDGIADLAAVSAPAAGGNATLSVWRHDGLSALLPAVTYPLAGIANSGGLALGDIDGDTLGDAVVANAAPTAPALWSLHQNGSGTLDAPVATTTSAAPGLVFALDLDRDGSTDLAAMHDANSATLTYRLQGVAGETAVPLAPANRYLPGDVAFGDLDGDGCTDAAVSSKYSNIVGSSASVGIVHGYGCTPNADLAASAVADGATGEAEVAVAHRGGTLATATLSVALRVSSKAKIDVPPDCDALIRLPPVRPGMITRSYVCDAGTLAPGERRAFVFGVTPGYAESVSVEASGDVVETDWSNNGAEAGFGKK
jgi:hypothetical protein